MARRVPALTKQIVANDELLGEWTDALLLNDKHLRRLSHRIIRTQDVLLAMITIEQRNAYFKVEEATNERLGEAVLTLARAAWRAGRRSR